MHYKTEGVQWFTKGLRFDVAPPNLTFDGLF